MVRLGLLNNLHKFTESEVMSDARILTQVFLAPKLNFFPWNIFPLLAMQNSNKENWGGGMAVDYLGCHIPCQWVGLSPIDMWEAV